MTFLIFELSIGVGWSEGKILVFDFTLKEIYAENISKKEKTEASNEWIWIITSKK